MTTQRTTRNFLVDVLVQEDQGTYVAQCLQFDIAVQASTEDELKARFSHALAAHVLEDLKSEREPLSTLPEAPRRFWEMFLRGKERERDLPIYVPSRAGKVDVRANFSKVPAAELRA